MSKIKMKQGSWGAWSAEVDGEDIGIHKLDQLTVIYTALVKHLGIEIEYNIFDGREERNYKVDETGELRRIVTEE